MSQSNGSAIVRIGRKGLKTFAFGEEGQPGSTPFVVDVVITFDQWLVIDNDFRPLEADTDGDRNIPRTEMPAYHTAAANFVESLRGGDKDAPGYEPVNPAEALDFLARLREEYDRLAHFFRPKLQEEQESPATSAVELRFSEEPKAN